MKTIKYELYQLELILNSLPQEPGVNSFPIQKSLFYRQNLMQEECYITKEELMEKEIFEKQYNSPGNIFKQKITTTLFALKILAELSITTHLNFAKNLGINSTNLSKVIFEFSFLEHLKINSTSICNDIVLLANTLVELTNLKSLDLSSNNLPEDGFLLAMQDLKLLKHLEGLNLSENLFPNNSAKILDQIAQMPALKKLYISNIGTNGQAIIDAINKPGLLKLEELDISCNNLSDISSANILEAITKLPLKFLDISDTNMFQKLPISGISSMFYNVVSCSANRLVKMLDGLINLPTLEKLLMSSENLSPKEIKQIKKCVIKSNEKQKDYIDGLNHLIAYNLDNILPENIASIIGDYLEPKTLILEFDYSTILEN